MEGLVHIRRWSHWVLDLVFPRACLGCGAEDGWLCASCRTSLPLLRAQTCPVCRQPGTGGACCPRCQGQTALDGLFVAVPYDTPLIHDLVHSLKYRFITDLGAELGTILGQRLNLDKASKQAILQRPDLTVVPVPLHRRRLRERGFNQAALIASALAGQLNLPHHPDVLDRSRYTHTQTELSRTERLVNIRHAFQMAEPFKNWPKNVILVDDVATTLATLSECAHVLKQHGVGTVWGAVIARGR